MAKHQPLVTVKTGRLAGQGLRGGASYLLRVFLGISIPWTFLCGAGPAESPPPFLLKWGSVGTGPGQFVDPLEVACDEDGLVYVADSHNNRIQVFSPTGTLLRSWGEYGYGPAQLDGPTGIAVAPGGNVYVTAFFNHAVKVYTRSGTFVAQWGRIGAMSGNGPGEFHWPDGIAIDDSGYVYVADSKNGRIQKLSADGAFVMAWAGSGESDVGQPRGIAVDRSGHVYVVSIAPPRILKFTLQGEFLGAFGQYPILDSPNHISTDVESNVYVTDMDNHRVVKFGPGGRLITSWGPGGNDDCQFDAPSGIEVDRFGNVYVTEPDSRFSYSEPSCVQKFGPIKTPVLPTTWGSLKVRYR